MFSLVLSQGAAKFLRKCDNDLRTRILRKAKTLIVHPVPSDSKFLTRDQGERVFRIRIGDYRVIYSLKDDLKVVLIAKIDKRSRVYKR